MRDSNRQVSSEGEVVVMSAHPSLLLFILVCILGFPALPAAYALRDSMVVSATVPFNKTDTDGDGLPDQWEQQFFDGNLANMDETTDSDGDGFPDLHEYLADTDPSDEFSALTLFGPVRSANGSLLIEWLSSPSSDPAPRRYKLLFATDISELSSNPETLAPDIPAGPGTTTSFELSTLSSFMRRFFRIQLIAPTPEP